MKWFLGVVCLWALPTYALSLNDIMYPETVTQSWQSFKDLSQKQGRLQPSLPAGGPPGGPLRSLQVDGATLQLVDADYVNGRPSLILQWGNQRLRLLSGDGLRQAAASAQILRELGFDLPLSEYVDHLKVRVDRELLPHVISVWSGALEPVPWFDHFEPMTSSQGEELFLSVKKAVVVVIPDDRERESRNTLEERLIAHLLLQNTEYENDFEPLHAEVDGLRFSLGHGKSYSTPNAYGNRLARLKLDRSGKVLEWQVPTITEKFRKHIAHLNLQTLIRFNLRLQGFNAQKLETILRQSDFPEAVIPLLAAKISSRWNVLASLMERSLPKLKVPWVHWSYTPPQNIQYKDQIKNGRLVKPLDDPDFLETASRFRILVHRFIKEIGQMADRAAQQAVSKLPIVEIWNVPVVGSKLAFTGSVILRMARSYETNPLAQSPEEAFKVRDSMTLGLFLGIGLPGVISEKVHLGLGGGWKRTVVSAHLTSSAREAKEGFWKMPYELFYANDLSKVGPGETIGIEDAWLLGGIGNINLMKLFRVKLKTVLMAAWENPHGIQFSKDHDGNVTVVLNDGSLFGAIANLNLKYYSRYLRIPLINASYSQGVKKFKVYQIPAPHLNGLDEEARLLQERLKYAEEFKDFSGLENFAESENFYNSRVQKHFGWFLFTRSGTKESSEGLEVQTKDEKEINRYEISSFKNSFSDHTHTLYGVWKCAFQGALSEMQTEVGFKMKCKVPFHFDSQKRNPVNWEETSIPLAQIFLKDKVTEDWPSPLQVTWDFEIGNDLLYFLNQDKAPYQIPSRIFGLLIGDEYFKFQVNEILKQKTLKGRFLAFVHLMRKSKAQRWLIEAVMNKAENFKYTLSLDTKTGKHPYSLDLSLGTEGLLSSKVLKYLKDREVTDSGLIFRDL